MYFQVYANKVCVASTFLSFFYSSSTAVNWTHCGYPCEVLLQYGKEEISFDIKPVKTRWEQVEPIRITTNCGTAVSRVSRTSVGLICRRLLLHGAKGNAIRDKVRGVHYCSPRYDGHWSEVESISTAPIPRLWKTQWQVAFTLDYLTMYASVDPLA